MKCESVIASKIHWTLINIWPNNAATTNNRCGREVEARFAHYHGESFDTITRALQYFFGKTPAQVSLGDTSYHKRCYRRSKGTKWLRLFHMYGRTAEYAPTLNSSSLPKSVANSDVLNAATKAKLAAKFFNLHEHIIAAIGGICILRMKYVWS